MSRPGARPSPSTPTGRPARPGDRRGAEGRRRRPEPGRPRPLRRRGPRPRLPGRDGGHRPRPGHGPLRHRPLRDVPSSGPTSWSRCAAAATQAAWCSPTTRAVHGLVRPWPLDNLKNWHYLHVSQDVLPYLREHDVPESDIGLMLVANPAASSPRTVTAPLGPSPWPGSTGRGIHGTPPAGCLPPGSVSWGEGQAQVPWYSATPGCQPVPGGDRLRTSLLIVVAAGSKKRPRRTPPDGRTVMATGKTGGHSGRV